MALYTNGKIYEDQARFFYYIAGISVAVFAYTVKELEPVKLGLNSHTIEIFGLALMAASILLCFSALTTLTMAEHTARMAIEILRGQDEDDKKLYEVLKEAVKFDEETRKLVGRYSAEAIACRKKKQEQASESHQQHKLLLPKLKNLRKWQWGTFLGSLFILAVAKILEPYLAEFVIHSS